jgi:hypothetical protein
MTKGQGIDHGGEKQDQHDLDHNVEADPDPADFHPAPRTRLF